MLRLRTYLGLVLFFCTLSIQNLSASLPLDLPYEKCNHHKFTFMLLKVYDVYLCADTEENFYPDKIFADDFSLSINYNMSFSKQELVDSSLEEISRYYVLNEEQKNIYANELFLIFKDVHKGDVIEARYSSDGSTSFFYNQSFIGKIKEREFSKIFLDIWLHKNNKYAAMTKDLFKIDGSDK